MTQHQGFTLIELVITLAIVAILMAALSFSGLRVRTVAFEGAAQTHGVAVAQAFSSFFIRNPDLAPATVFGSYTANTAPGKPSGVPATAFDCTAGATLSRSSITAGSGSWNNAPSRVNCEFTTTTTDGTVRPVTYTWVTGSSRYYVNGN